LWSNSTEPMVSGSNPAAAASASRTLVRATASSKTLTGARAGANALMLAAGTTMLRGESL
jgi:hypothetical protein